MKYFYNNKQAAEYLGVSPETMKCWRNRKLYGVTLFPADLKVHGKWFYHHERLYQLKSVYGKFPESCNFRPHSKDEIEKLQQGKPNLNVAFFSIFNPLNSDTKSFDLVDSKKAAAILGVSPETLKCWRNRKRFGVTLFPADLMCAGKWYYYRDRIEQLKSVYRQFPESCNFKSSPSKVTADESQRVAPEEKNRFFSDFDDDDDEDSVDLFNTDGAFSAFGTVKTGEDSTGFETHCNNFYAQKSKIEFMGADDEKVLKPIELNDFIQTTEDPFTADRKIKSPIRPSGIRIELNDKLTKYLFSFTEEATKAFLRGVMLELVEKPNYRKRGDVITLCKISNVAGYSNQRPLREFDRAVLSVCISEQMAGNFYTTPAVIYRGLTGKVGKSDAEPSKDQLSAIIDSVNLLMNRVIAYDATDLCERMNYNNHIPIKKRDRILPARLINVPKPDGKSTLIIYFERECPLWSIAKAKRQIITYKTGLLNTHTKRNSFMNIELKNYALRRVLEIISHKMKPAITFQDAFSKCRIKNASNRKKFDGRSNLIAFFKHLRNENLIDDFDITVTGGCVSKIVISKSQS